MAESRITLRHSVTGGTWECPVGAVDAWLAKGWMPADSTALGADENAPVDGESEPAKGRNPKGSK